MSEERKLQNDVINATNRRKDVRLFKNDVGQCRESNIGLRYGLIPGSSDLIGWTKKIVTQDMVGKPVAIFTAVELKVKKRKPTIKQIIFIENVRKFGGIAVVVRDIKDLPKVFGEEDA